MRIAILHVLILTSVVYLKGSNPNKPAPIGTQGFEQIQYASPTTIYNLPLPAPSVEGPVLKSEARASGPVPIVVQEKGLHSEGLSEIGGSQTGELRRIEQPMYEERKIATPLELPHVRPLTLY